MAHKCRVCNGDKKYTCPRCGGHGKMLSGEKCYFCQGEKKVPCTTCNKNGEVED